MGWIIGPGNSFIFRQGGGNKWSSYWTKLTFDDIVNVPVADASSVSDWNTWFDLPTNGTPYTSVSVDGNVVTLEGGSEIKFKDYLFGDDACGEHILEIEDSGCVTELGEGVFSDYGSGLCVGCYNLTKVNLPICNKLGKYAFGDCQELVNLVISFDDFTAIDESVFDYCYKLPDIYFPNLITIGASSFRKCKAFINPDFSKVVTTGYQAFSGCEELIKPNFDSLITAGEGCFLNCTKLKNPAFPKLETAGVVIGSGVFENCISLETSLFPLLTYCGMNTFIGCVSLVNPSFPALITVGRDCFVNCTELTNPSYPLLENMEIEGCFWNCSKLINSDFSKVKSVVNVAFYGCTSFTNILLNSCTALGLTVGLNNVFQNITGKTITLTVPAALMTCNGGNPDGDIAYLQANNTVTVIQV